MIRFKAVTLGLTLIGLAFVLPSQLIAYTGEKLAKGAKVSIDQARAIALKAKPGTISGEELEREKAWSQGTPWPVGSGAPKPSARQWAPMATL